MQAYERAKEVAREFLIAELVEGQARPLASLPTIASVDENGLIVRFTFLRHARSALFSKQILAATIGQDLTF